MWRSTPATSRFLAAAVIRRPVSWTPALACRFSASSSPPSGPSTSSPSPDRTWSKWLKGNGSSAIGSHNATGLFGIPELQRPDDFHRLAMRAIERCDKLSMSLATVDRPPVDTLHKLDQISDEICKVIDVAGLCCNVHTSAEWRNSAEAVVHQLTAYIATLNTNRVLYDALVRALEAPEAKHFTEEQLLVGLSLKHEFERDGIHMSEEDRAKVVEANSRIGALRLAFSKAVNADVSMFEVSPAETLRALPQSLLERIPKQPLSLPKNTALLSTDSLLCSSILRLVPNADVRRQVMTAQLSDSRENLAILADLADARAELAELTGFDSFASYATSDRMMASPENVMTFLEQLSAHVKPLAEAELAVLKSAKALDIGTDVESVTLEPWDVAFYKNRVLQHNEELLLHLAPYLHLEGALRGLGFVLEQIFGVSLLEVAMSPAERWTNEGIRKFTLHHETDGPLGIIYLDLQSRRGKFSGSAQFVVRCGRELRGDTGSLGPTDVTVGPDGKQYQLPVVCLVTSFGQADNGTLLLSPGQLRTLFHEFGHALHSLLSRTELQHLSGTRGALDFVELPSHLFEYFATDERVLKRFARDVRTGLPIPDELAPLVGAWNARFPALDLQMQIVHSMFDQVMFGARLPRGVSDQDVANAGDGETTPRSSRILEAIQNAHCAIPFVKGTCWEAQFGHLVDYGAGYYSYLTARAFAAATWQKCFKEDPFRRSGGDRFRDLVLSKGGARDPRLVMQDLIGAEPDPEALLEEIQRTSIPTMMAKKSTE